MSTEPDSHAHDLSIAILRRARLQAELAGLDALKAAKAVTQARRRYQLADREPLTFWHALYIELAPLAAPATNAVLRHPEPRVALTALSLEERTAVLLRIGERLDTAAIGKVLDEPDERVRAHLALGLKRLRKALGEGREDHLWLGELDAWLGQQADIAVHTSVDAPAGAVPTLDSSAMHRTAAASPKASNRRSRLPVWLGLMALLAAVGAARMTADRWMHLSKPAADAVIVTDPLIDWLLLSDDDLELVKSVDSPETVAQLDFLLWLEQSEPAESAAEDADATP